MINDSITSSTHQILEGRRREEKMAFQTLLKFLYPPPQSFYITAMALIGPPTIIIIGFMEIFGKHLQYSKFAKVGPQKSEKKNPQISSRNGMLLLYTPAFLAGAVSFWVFPGDEFRLTLVAAALTIHFLKRVLEVLFVHKYSGSMDVKDTLVISLSYFTGTVTMIYAQHLSRGLPEPSIDLKFPGIALFLIGIGGNFYHHYILSTLRTKGEKGYKIPRGGLFKLVICPHYLFEILGFVGITCMSQTVYSFSFTCATIVYLLGRSYATRNWYISKFEDFPKNVKALIPYIF